MKWKKIKRGSDLVEYECEHGVGHPDGTSIYLMNERGPEGARGTWGVHGCDGCCRRDDFPGRQHRPAKE